MGKELEQIEPTECEITLKGKKRKLKCTLYTWKQIQNKYSTISNITMLEKDMEERPLDIIPQLIIWCINPKEVENDELEETDVLMEYATFEDLRELVQKIGYCIKNSMPKKEKKTGK